MGTELSSEINTRLTGPRESSWGWLTVLLNAAVTPERGILRCQSARANGNFRRLPIRLRLHASALALSWRGNVDAIRYHLLGFADTALPTLPRSASSDIFTESR